MPIDALRPSPWPSQVSRLTKIVAIYIGGIVIFAIFCSSVLEWVTRSDSIPLFILVLSFFAPFLILFAARALIWNRTHATASCILVLFLLSAVFRIRAIDDKSIDLQIFIRIVCLLFMSMMIATARVHRFAHVDRIRKNGLASLAVVVYTILECFNAVNPPLAFVEATSNVISVLFILCIIETFDAFVLIKVLVIVGFMMCLASFIVYFVDPQLGRMTDWVDNAYVTTSRLQGVFGTPNNAGASAAFCLLLVLLVGQNRSWNALRILEIAVFTITVVASNNRMAILTVGCALAFFVIHRRGSKLAIAIAIVVLASLVLFYIQFGEVLLNFVTRRGDIDEILSGDGRLQIWNVVLQLWSERPLFGYGVGSAKFILPHHPLLFAAAAHAHSLYLNVLFAGGVIGLSMLVCALTSALWNAQVRRLSGVMSLLIFFCLYGITEPLIGGIASFMTLAFFSALLLGGGKEIAPPAAYASTHAKPTVTTVTHSGALPLSAIIVGD